MTKSALEQFLQQKRNKVVPFLDEELRNRKSSVEDAKSLIEIRISEIMTENNRYKQRLLKDLDVFYDTNIPPLQAKLQAEKALIDKVNELRSFIEDLREMGADCDLVQF